MNSVVNRINRPAINPEHATNVPLVSSLAEHTNHGIINQLQRFSSVGKLIQPTGHLHRVTLLLIKDYHFEVKNKNASIGQGHRPSLFMG